MSQARWTLCSAVILGALAVLPVLGSASPTRRLTNDDQDLVGRFRAALSEDGYDVSPGATAVLNPKADWCAGGNPGGYGHAFYVNDQPYLGLLVPRSASQPQLTGVFQLGATEAIVLIGLTPPPERYFGFYPFLRTRVIDGTRQRLWATLGDAVNNATIHTTGPTPFGSPVAIIFTPDQGTDTRVRAALRRAGYPAEIINTVVFPASMLNLGHADTADELTIVLRNAIWRDEADGDAYIRNPPFRLFRVTPRADAPASPFPAPPLRVRGTGRTEMDLMSKLGQLRQGLIDANPGLHFKDLTTQVAGYEGYDHIQRGVDPWADARDTIFLASGWVPEFGSMYALTLEDDEFLMVYGANHVATGKASYHSLTFYSSKDGKVPIGGVDDRAFPGTTTPYLHADPAASKLMYAYKVSRNCGNEPNCLPLSIDECPRLTVDRSTVLGLFVRMYLEPATKVGPAMPEIVYDRVIKFSPRPLTSE